jgi:hypothetical protein
MRRSGNVNAFGSRDRVSLAALIVANFIPLGGVLFAGWDAGTIVLLYWSENLIIGFYNVVKLALAKTDDSVQRVAKLFAIPFFCVHYGMFCFGHGVFVLVLISMRPGEGPNFSTLKPLLGQMLWPFLGLFVSHGVSFVQNTLLHREYKSITVRQQMMQPYARIILLHVAIILSGFLIMTFGSPLTLLLLLIAGKIVLDLVLHARSHGSRPGERAAGASPDEDAA